VFPVCASTQTSVLHGRVHVEVACMDVRSRGSVHIRSGDPETAPKIDHRYLSDRGGHDLQVLREGVKIAEQLLSHPQLAEVLGEKITDMTYEAAYYETVSHYYHPVGTCAMGDEYLSVCDARGRVRGLPQVMVADASLMPQIVRANTNIPTVMIGERIADFILADTSPTG
jgi:choline dehydrogenase